MLKNQLPYSNVVFLRSAVLKKYAWAKPRHPALMLKNQLPYSSVVFLRSSVLKKYAWAKPRHPVL
jgi:hypothetical protein